MALVQKTQLGSWCSLPFCNLHKYIAEVSVTLQVARAAIIAQDVSSALKTCWWNTEHMQHCWLALINVVIVTMIIRCACYTLMWGQRACHLVHWPWCWTCFNWKCFALNAQISWRRCYRVTLTQVIGLVLLGTHQSSHVEWFVSQWAWLQSYILTRHTCCEWAASRRNTLYYIATLQHSLRIESTGCCHHVLLQCITWKFQEEFYVVPY